MRALIQRVAQASVTVADRLHAAIGPGLLVFLGIESGDNTEDVDWLAAKVVRLRIFPDQNGVMNRAVHEIAGGILVVSQFTLHASTRRGNRPSYSRAAPPREALPLYEAFLDAIGRVSGNPPASGVFGADMQIHLHNDGPVTVLIDSRLRE